MALQVIKTVPIPNIVKCETWFTSAVSVGGKVTLSTPIKERTITSDASMSQLYMGYGRKLDVQYNRTKGFKKGVLSVNPFVVSESESSCSYASEIVSYNTFYGVTYVQSRLVGNPIVHTKWPLLPATVMTNTSNSGYQDQAIMNAVNKTTAAQIDLSVSLAEAGETLKMIASPFRSLIKLTRKLQRPKTFKRSRKFNPGSSISYASNAWLQYRYGIMPLVNDIDGGLDAYEQSLMRTDNRLRSKRSKVSFQAQVSRSLGTSGPYNYGPTFAYDRITTTKRFTSAVCYFRVVDPVAYERSRIGLNSVDMFGTAYELIPFSFVVDWFIGIGDWLKYCRPRPEIKTLGLSTGFGTTRTTETRALTYTWGKTTAPCDVTLTLKEQMFTRNAFRVDVPYLIPRVGTGISSLNRLFDSLALTWQLSPLNKSEFRSTTRKR